MNIYKVEAELYGCLLTAVVACEKESDAVKLTSFSTDTHQNHVVTLIGKSTYTKPTNICEEDL